MAVQNSSLGLRKIEYADVSPAGLPAVWTELEDVAIDSANLTESDATYEDISIEQRSGTYRRIITEDATMLLTANIYDLKLENFLAFKGGEISPAAGGLGRSWGTTRETITVRKAWRMTTFDDYTIILPDADTSALVVWNFAKSQLGTLTINATPLLPQDESLGAIMVYEPFVATGQAQPEGE